MNAREAFSLLKIVLQFSPFDELAGSLDELDAPDLK